LYHFEVEGFMEKLIGNMTQYLGDFGSVIKGTVLVVVVIIVLNIMSRILDKYAAKGQGSKFRNQLIMFGASFVALLMVILGLPIDSATRGQLLGLVGIIISAGIALSSSTFIGNAMAGIMLKTVRNFRTGDFVKTESVFGRVTERGLFHTEIQTPDRDLTTLPNLYLATNAVTVVRQSGTIIGATVSLGYDVHHTLVEELLLKAAVDSDLQDPFIQVLELGDYSIVYRVAGLLTETKQLIAYRSRLHTAMLDRLHEGGVEIVSPQFNNARVLDVSKEFIPRPSKIKTTPIAHAAPVDVAFDKAEEAEVLDAKRQELAELENAKKELEKIAKSGTPDEKNRLQSKIEKLEPKIENLAEVIAEKESEENEDKD
jgi:small conductance mechanosensitive channel